MPGGRKPALLWFRNDLRLHDHEPLAAACAGATSVLPVYIFDPREYGKVCNCCWLLLCLLSRLLLCLRRLGNLLRLDTTTCWVFGAWVHSTLLHRDTTTALSAVRDCSASCQQLLISTASQNGALPTIEAKAFFGNGLLPDSPSLLMNEVRAMNGLLRWFAEPQRL
jgi:deoxyribodipyrimidine photolyase